VEGNLLEGVAVIRPGGTETDVSQADGAPRKQNRETGESLQPIEHNGARCAEVDVRKGTREDQDEHREERSAGAINIGENLRSVALLRKGSQGARPSEDGRHADGEHRDEDDDVHEVIEAVETCIFADEHPRRGLDVRKRLVREQTRVVRRH